MEWWLWLMTGPRSRKPRDSFFVSVVDFSFHFLLFFVFQKKKYLSRFSSSAVSVCIFSFFVCERFSYYVLDNMRCYFYSNSSFHITISTRQSLHSKPILLQFDLLSSSVAPWPAWRPDWAGLWALSECDGRRTSAIQRKNTEGGTIKKKEKESQLFCVLFFFFFFFFCCVLLCRQTRTQHNV